MNCFRVLSSSCKVKIKITCKEVKQRKTRWKNELFGINRGPAESYLFALVTTKIGRVDLSDRELSVHLGLSLCKSRIINKRKQREDNIQHK